MIPPFFSLKIRTKKSVHPSTMLKALKCCFVFQLADFGLAHASKDGSICFEPVYTEIRGKVRENPYDPLNMNYLFFVLKRSKCWMASRLYGS